MTIDECKANLRMISILMDDNEQAEVIELTCKNACEWLEELKCHRNDNDFSEYADRLYKNAYNKAIDELKSKKDEIIRWLIKRDKEGYGTTNGELLDHVFEIAEQLKK